jgi:hypothetical protein
MLKTVLSFGFIILMNLAIQAQLDSYKYIVVPKKFDGFKYENQFRTSTQIKHLFTQNGFNVIYEDQISPDLAENPCLGVRVVLLDDSSLLATRVRLGLKDCNGVVVYETEEGKSKSKEYEFAYREAIDGAFKSLEGFPYSYIPPEAATGAVATNQTASQVSPSVSSEVATANEVTAQQGALSELSAASEVASEAADSGSEVLTPVAAGTAAIATAVIAKPSDAEEEVAPSGTAVQVQTDAGTEIWYAQAIDNGYQLVDSTPKIRMKLLKTEQKDTFIATVDGEALGMVYKKDGQWWHEYFKEGKTEVRALNLKF